MKRSRKDIPPGRFIAALIGGPFWGTCLALAVGAVIWLPALALGHAQISYAFLLLIPGILFGAPFYATAGAAAFYVTLRLGAGHSLFFALAGFVANLLTPLVFLLWNAGTALDDMGLAFSALGAVAAPIYGFGFGHIYLHLTRKGQANAKTRDIAEIFS